MHTSAHSHNTLARPVQVWAALCTVYVLWGSTYLAIAIVVSGAPPLLSAGSRFFAGGLILAAIVGFRNGWRTLRVTRRELGGAALIGILLLGIGSGGVSLAERYVPSSSSALVIASVPLWLICLRTATKDRPAALTWAGVVCGFLGVGLLVAELGRDDPAPGDGYINLPGWQVALWLGVIVVGSITWAIGSFISPRLVAAERAPRNPMVLAAWQFLIAGVLLMVVGVGRGEDATAMAHLSTKTAVAWLLLVAIAVIAFSSYTWLLQNAPISLTSTYAYVNPLVAMLLGWLLLSEPMSPLLLVSAALIVFGVLLVVRAETRAPDRTG